MFSYFESHFFSIRGLADLPQKVCLFFVVVVFLGVAVSWSKCIYILKSCFCQTLNVKQKTVKFDCEVLYSLLEPLWSFSRHI